jgi:solute:Na+ symporter, SSS family
MNGVLAGVVAYVLIQFAIGTIVSRRMASDTDYILAGRRLGLALVTSSVFATFFGVEAIVATGGAVYERGLSGALADPFGYAAGITIAGLLLARALWSRGLTTFADLFRARYSPGVERLVVAVLLPGSIIWAAAQMRAFGQILSANSGMTLVIAITLAAVLVGAYSVVGGLMADAVTDLIQGLAVLVGLVVLFAIVAGHVGGVGTGLAQVAPEQLKLIGPEDGPLGVLEKLAVPVCGTIVAVELISRYLGARTGEVAAMGTAAGGAIYFLVGLIPIFLGLMAPRLLPRVEDAEQTIARLAVMVLCCVAYVISVLASGIHELVETASAFGSAGVFVATMFALFTRIGGSASAYASIGAGLLTWGAGKLFDLQTPYLLALVAAAAGYVLLALYEKRFAARALLE